jgi:hypothetical protein
LATQCGFADMAQLLRKWKEEGHSVQINTKIEEQATVDSTDDDIPPPPLPRDYYE